MIKADRNMSYKLKQVVFFLKAVVNLALLRPFGNIIHDVAEKYKGILSVADLRKLEKLFIKRSKAQMDVKFLKSCQTFNVFPKFLAYRLPYCNTRDEKFIRKRLLRTALHRRKNEERRINSHLLTISNDVRNVVNTVEWYML